MHPCERCGCGGHLEDRTVSVKMMRDGQQVVLDDVAQGTCMQCGSRVYPMQILERVESTLRGDDVDALLHRLSAPASSTPAPKE